MKLNKKLYTLFMGLAFTATLTAKTELNENEKLNEVHLLNTIEFIEDDDEIELGFDVAYYLPFGFDPYKGMIFPFSEIEYIEDEECIDLGFDTSTYLPNSFNPYVGQ